MPFVFGKQIIEKAPVAARSDADAAAHIRTVDDELRRLSIEIGTGMLKSTLDTVRGADNAAAITAQLKALAEQATETARLLDAAQKDR